MTVAHLASVLIRVKSGAVAAAWRLHVIDVALFHFAAVVFGLRNVRTHDVAVPVAAVPEFIATADRMLAEHYPRATSVVVSHMGDGNVHYIAMFSFADWEAVADKAVAIDDLRARVHDIAAALGGSFSAEHGIGCKLVGELERLTAPLELQLTKGIKCALDPANVMNPGVMIR